MTDIERLVNSHFPIVEKLLLDFGEFFPIGAVLYNDNGIAPIKPEIKGEHPLSTEVIESLLATIRSHKQSLKLAAIFYDVRIQLEENNSISDAIAVFIESKLEESACVTYYPYFITTENKLQLGTSWEEKSECTIWTEM
jgi:hypothetical protein